MTDGLIQNTTTFTIQGELRRFSKCVILGNLNLRVILRNFKPFSKTCKVGCKNVIHRKWKQLHCIVV